MLNKETEALILRLHHAEKWPIGTIAVQLGLHHDAVERVLERDGAMKPKIIRPSMVDPYLPFILETLKKYPKLRASRLFHMCVERGYPGGEGHFRHLIQGLRPKPAAEAFLRLKTLPAEQSQVDWAHFGKVKIGRAERPLMAFLLVLSYSRWMFCRFFFSAKTDCFLEGHVRAFEEAAGCARIVLYDNLKSAVLERRGPAIRFNPRLLEFAAHYRYEPRPVAPYRGSEKGRVERAVRYLREAFFAGRPFQSLEALNEQVRTFCLGPALDRPWPEDRRKTVRDAFLAEQGQLLQLPDDPFPVFERVEVKAGKTPYIRFDGNDYSVPHTKVRRMLTVLATQKRVRIVEGDQVVADHERSFDRHQTIEDLAHVEALVLEKRRARKERGIDRLTRAAPSVEPLLCELASRGENLGSICAQLLRLLSRYGGSALEAAAKEALTNGAFHPRSVELILERRQLATGQPPPIPVDLPDDARIQNLSVRPHALEGYDDLTKDEQDDDDGKEQTDGDTDSATNVG